MIDHEDVLDQLRREKRQRDDAAWESRRVSALVDATIKAHRHDPDLAQIEATLRGWRIDETLANKRDYNGDPLPRLTFEAFSRAFPAFPLALHGRRYWGKYGEAAIPDVRGLLGEFMGLQPVQDLRELLATSRDYRPHGLVFNHKSFRQGVVVHNHTALVGPSRGSIVSCCAGQHELLLMQPFAEFARVVACTWAPG